jgi:hypothetical protein
MFATDTVVSFTFHTKNKSVNVEKMGENNYFIVLQGNAFPQEIKLPSLTYSMVSVTKLHAFRICKYF